eukprot:EG_transcript_60010
MRQQKISDVLPPGKLSTPISWYHWAWSCGASMTIGWSVRSWPKVPQQLQHAHHQGLIHLKSVSYWKNGPLQHQGLIHLKSVSYWKNGPLQHHLCHRRQTDITTI